MFLQKKHELQREGEEEKIDCTNKAYLSDLLVVLLNYPIIMWLANHFYKMIYLQTKRVSKNKFFKDSQLIHFSFVFDCLGETNQISCPTPTLFLLKAKK